MNFQLMPHTTWCRAYTTSLIFILLTQPVPLAETATSPASPTAQLDSPVKIASGTNEESVIEDYEALLLKRDDPLGGNVGGVKEVHNTDEVLSSSADNVEDVGHSAIVAEDGEENGEREGAGNEDEDMYTWIEDVRQSVQI